jgi:peptide/nickel transport system ATP-binding protein
MTETAVQIRDLDKTFGGGRSLTGKSKPSVHAVRQVNLHVNKGETVGIVGESGCGKSTLARMLVGLETPTAGTIAINGRDLAGKAGPREFGRTIQYVFQDPLSSLNPRKTIRQILQTPLTHLLGMDGTKRSERIRELMEVVNLREEFLTRYPHEFSGGQAQRIGIARALAADAEILVLDEPVSALDVSVQAQVLNLLDDLKRAYDLTYLFISHDLAVVESISDRVAVMYFGQIVEEGPADALFRSPRHPYTSLLFAAAPVPGEKSVRGEKEAAELPDPLAPPPGCAFAARCSRASDICRHQQPPLTQDGDRSFACYNPQNDNG